MDLRERKETRLKRQELLLDLLHWATRYWFYVASHTERLSAWLLAVDAQTALITGEPMSQVDEDMFRSYLRQAIFAPVMGIEGAAAYLGISVGNIRYHIREGNLQPFKAEGMHAWLFTLDDLDRFIHAREEGWSIEEMEVA